MLQHRSGRADPTGQTPEPTPPGGDGAADRGGAPPCPDFLKVRAAAAADPVLGLLWHRLFDDSNP